MIKNLSICRHYLGLHRSDGVSLYPVSRMVYINLWTCLFGCSLERCKFPTITCDKCSYAYE